MGLHENMVYEQTQTEDINYIIKFSVLQEA
jgi:hypothetical protein